MLARGLVDEFWYNKLGNQVTLVKRLEIQPSETAQIANSQG